jgi:hypothetical protein
MKPILLAVLLSAVAPAFAADQTGKPDAEPSTPQSPATQGNDGGQDSSAQSSGQIPPSEPAILTFCRTHTC